MESHKKKYYPTNWNFIHIKKGNSNPFMVRGRHTDKEKNNHFEIKNRMLWKINLAFTCQLGRSNYLQEYYSSVDFGDFVVVPFFCKILISSKKY